MSLTNTQTRNELWDESFSVEAAAAAAAAALVRVIAAAKEMKYVYITNLQGFDGTNEYGEFFIIII